MLSSSSSSNHHATHFHQVWGNPAAPEVWWRILLDYLLESIMGFPTDSKVKQALTDAGMQSIVDLFTMEIDLFSQLTYKVGTEWESLRLLDVSKLRKIGHFHDALCDR